MFSKLSWESCTKQCMYKIHVVLRYVLLRFLWQKWNLSKRPYTTAGHYLAVKHHETKNSLCAQLMAECIKCACVCDKNSRHNEHRDIFACVAGKFSILFIKQWISFDDFWNFGWDSLRLRHMLIVMISLQSWDDGLACLWRDNKEQQHLFTRIKYFAMSCRFCLPVNVSQVCTAILSSRLEIVIPDSAELPAYFLSPVPILFRIHPPLAWKLCLSSAHTAKNQTAIEMVMLKKSLNSTGMFLLSQYHIYTCPVKALWKHKNSKKKVRVSLAKEKKKIELSAPWYFCFEAAR